MRKTITLAAACAAALLLPAAAGAAPAAWHERVAPSTTLRSHLANARGGFPARYTPLARTLTGTATVKVQASDYYGNDYSGAEADWWVTAGTDQASGYGTLNGSGAITFTGVPAAGADQGEVAVYPTSGDVILDASSLTWPDPAGIDMALQPGALGMTLIAGGAWRNYGYAWVDVYGSNGSGGLYTGSVVPQDGTFTNGEPLALEGDLSSSAVYFWNDQGKEVSLVGLTAAAGSTTASGVNIHQDSSPQIFNGTWASGRPGSAFKVSFRHFPAGWVNGMWGFSDAGGPGKSYGNWTSPGGSAWTTRSFTIPRAAKPGFDYWVNAAHKTGPLTLAEPFQVCSLVPSNAVAYGAHGITMSGRVPFTKGASNKRVLLYRRFTAGGQPKYLGGFASYKGWKRIKSFSTHDSGHFTSPRFWPTRTAWYCLWYPKDRGHWGAWTSVVKVTKR